MKLITLLNDLHHVHSKQPDLTKTLLNPDFLASLEMEYIKTSVRNCAAKLSAHFFLQFLTHFLLFVLPFALQHHSLLQFLS